MIRFIHSFLLERVTSTTTIQISTTTIRSMILSPAHQHDLWSIGLRGLATLLTLSLVWSRLGTTTTTLLSLRQWSQYLGACCTTVVIGCFVSAYGNLLVTNLTVERRRLGFCLFWFVGCLVLDVIWHIPYWWWHYHHWHHQKDNSSNDGGASSEVGASYSNHICLLYTSPSPRD